MNIIYWNIHWNILLDPHHCHDSLVVRKGWNSLPGILFGMLMQSRELQRHQSIGWKFHCIDLSLIVMLISTELFEMFRETQSFYEILKAFQRISRFSDSKTLRLRALSKAFPNVWSSPAQN